MSRILLQTTICAHPEDWDVSRFSLLADELRADQGVHVPVPCVGRIAARAVNAQPSTAGVQPLHERLALLCGKYVTGNIVPNNQFEFAQYIWIVDCSVVGDEDIPALRFSQFRENFVRYRDGILVNKSVGLVEN